MKRSELREGDVLRYTPATQHCREGVAIVVDLRGGLLDSYDTYWNTARVWVSDTELKTATVTFNLHDYRLAASKEEWLSFAPADRTTISHQHGTQVELYVRTEAQPDLHTEIANATDAVRQAELDVTAAQSRLRRAQHRLDDLHARAAAAQEASA